MSSSTHSDYSTSSFDKGLLLAHEYGESSSTSEELRNPSHRPLKPSVLIHVLAITAYTLFFIFLSLPQQSNSSSIVYSPAREAISYTSKTVSVLYNDTSNPFLNAPSTELDHSWSTLLQNMNVRLTASELAKLGRDSIKLGDGSGDSLGSLDVYHQLHCVKYLRSYIDGVPLPAMRVSHKDHANHCLELLRQILICHGDIAVVTYDWLPEDRVPLPRWEIEHECVNWGMLDSWAAERRVRIFEKGMIAHPVLGASYPDRSGH